MKYSKLMLIGSVVIAGSLLAACSDKTSNNDKTSNTDKPAIESNVNTFTFEQAKSKASATITKYQKEPNLLNDKLINTDNGKEWTNEYGNVIPQTGGVAFHINKEGWVTKFYNAPYKDDKGYKYIEGDITYADGTEMNEDDHRQAEIYVQYELYRNYNELGFDHFPTYEYNDSKLYDSKEENGKFFFTYDLSEDVAESNTTLSDTNSAAKSEPGTYTYTFIFDKQMNLVGWQDEDSVTTITDFKW